MELLLELSGLSRQSLVIKACTSDSRSFEAVAATLVEHYSGVHLKEGRSLGGGTFQDRRHNNHGARPKSNPKGYGKGKTRGFTAAPTSPKTRRTLLTTTRTLRRTRRPKTTTTLRTPPLGTNPPSTRHTPTPPGRRTEATALNCLEDLDPEEAESGHVIQLQLAANAAKGRARGRKGKGKGKGKSIRVRWLGHILP